jgi:hypothetical protein
MTLDKPGFDEEFEMAGDAWLRLTENRDKFADRELGLGDQGEQAQTRGFTGDRRGGENGIERDGLGHEIPAEIASANNMQIYLYVKTFSTPLHDGVVLVRFLL